MQPPAARRSWQEQWLRFRNRLIGDARFQRWAAGFPLTRRIAARRTRALFDLVAGFVYSQVLAACVELELFDILAEAPLSPSAVAARVGLGDAATERLLKAAASLDLVELLRDGRYSLGQAGAALRGNPAVRAMIAHHVMLYADLADPVALLRGDAKTTQLAGFWPYAASPAPATIPPDRVDAYSALMAQSQAFVADEVLDAYPMDRHRCLLDIGGGEGVFLAAAGRRAPQLRLMLFDLPAVVGRAPPRLAAAGVAERTTLLSGSFFTDPLPPGADVISLVRVIHDHDDEAALALLCRAREALAPDGRLLIAEPMSGTRGAAPAGDAYFGFYLAAMGSGRPRTPNELSAMVQRAGFSAPRLLATRTPLVIRALIADADGK
jgi:demethylspheroidene O-methyltransferase